MKNEQKILGLCVIKNEDDIIEYTIRLYIKQEIDGIFFW